MRMPASRTLPNLLDEMAQRYPGQEFIVYGDDRLTYPETRERVRQLAKGLRALGIGKGDKVALLMGNQTEWLLIDFAVVLLGAVLVPINTWYKTHELDYVLQHCDAKLLITVERYLNQKYMPMLREIGVGTERFPKLETIVALGRKDHSGVVAYERLADLGAAVSDAELDAAQAATDPGDIAYILYTSGTTSRPKGAQLTHRGLIENMFNIGERQRQTQGERMWMGTSLFWGFGCENALIATMTHGGCIVLQHWFDPVEAMRIIERESCTIYYGTPNMAIALHEHPDRHRYDLGSLRSGAAFGSPQAMQMVRELGAEQICQCYGLTESYGNCSITDAHDPPEVALTTVGKPLPGNEIVVADPKTHEPLPPGEPGEIKIRGYVTPGYYKDPEKNAEVFDRDGFFLSGDLGHFDDDGNLRFRTRVKEMLKSGGINVAPREIEEFLTDEPRISEAHVFGVPDAVRDEVVAAAIVLKDGATAGAAELQALCKANLANYKVPQHFWFVERDELPRTASGKVQKNRLRDQYLEQLERGEAPQRGVR